MRQVQQRLILQPLLAMLGSRSLIQTLKPLLAAATGYQIGNVINLLLVAGESLTGLDLSHCVIREVDFQDACLQDVNLSYGTCDRCLFAQVAGMPLQLLFSPDGRWLAAGDTNSQIKIWEVSTMQEIATLTGHGSWVRSVGFSADSQLLVSGSSDGTIRLWDIASQRCLQVLYGHQDWVWRVQFASRKSLIVSFGLDRQCRVWYWKLGKSVLSLTIRDRGLRNVMFDPNHGVMAVCSVEGIKLWLLWRLQYLRSITEKATHLRRVVFSPDGKMLVGADLNCQIHCWEVDTGRLIHTLTGHPSQISEMNFSDSGQIISTCLDQIRLWNPQTGVCLRTIDLSQSGSRVADYRPPSLQHPELLATGSDNGLVKLWNVSSGECMMSAVARSPQMVALAVNPEGRLQFATGDSEGCVQLWDGIDRSPQHLLGHRGLILSLAYSPSGQLLASGSHDRQLRIWNSSTGECLRTLLGHSDHVAQIIFIDEQTVLTTSYDCTIRQWQLSTGESIVLSYNQADFILGCAVSPDRLLLAVATPQEVLTVYDRQTHAMQAYPFVGNRMHYLTYQPDGHLIGVTDDAVLNHWNPKGELIAHWPIADREIRAIALDPQNPQRLVTTGDDGCTRLWDLSRHICLAQTHPTRSHCGMWAFWQMGRSSPVAKMARSSSGTSISNLACIKFIQVNPMQASILLKFRD
ncbi:MAG: WD40 repeat domain-containing protein [Alkalinema sp. RU_4_3]|nr:WD40 repeat domain-containing protein [Alkalinema sp. RU_4_3]